MKHKVKNIHFIGIAGSGMSGIAEVMLNLGFQVSGSDLADNAVTDRLKQAGATVFQGHAARHLSEADVVVVSSAVNEANPEVIAARAQKIPVIPRAMMLAELMRFRQGIAVAGTHGKTTTTSLIASILAEAGMDPTYVIGGRLEAANANAKLGEGEFIVAEADESDASFLHLSPVMAVVTNIDADHMETYEHSFEKLKNAFLEFVQQLPFWGMAVLCIDDANIAELLPRVSKPVTTYGFSEQANVRAVNVRADGPRMLFTVERRNGVTTRFDVCLNLPGRHYVQNALAAIAIASELNVADAAIIKALAEFRGVGRRFEQYGEIALAQGGHFSLIDDYGHHPVELQAVIDAARAAYPGRRLVMAFQPHRYTRTRDCMQAFIAVLQGLDVLLLTDVYAAGEAVIAGADSQSLMHALQACGTAVHYTPDTQQLPEALLRVAQDGDVVIVMGAGSIGQVAQKTKELAA